MDKGQSRVTRAAGIISAATFFSRILGFVRDAAIASFFGAGLVSDALFAAIRIPNFFRKMLSDGAVNCAIVPFLTEHLARRDQSDTFRLIRSILIITGIFLTFISIAGVLFSSTIVRFMVPGFVEEPEKFLLTVTLVRIIMPYIFFAGLLSVFMGALNTLGHFTAPALAPAILNIGILAALFLICPILDAPVFGVGYAFLAAGFFQVFFQVPFFRRFGFRLRGTVDFRDHALRKLGKSIPPVLFGVTVYQINIFAGTLPASLLPDGGVSCLYYADRLIQFPLGLFAVAGSTAVLPTLSRQAAENGMDDLKKTFSRTLTTIMFPILPAMAGLIVLRNPIVSLLFQRGAFGSIALANTSDALFYFCTGLWAFAVLPVTVSVFYALGDTGTPVIGAMISISANLILGFLLIGPLAHKGPALAASIASAVDVFFLFFALERKLGGIPWKRMLFSACKSGVNSLLMGVMVGFSMSRIIPDDIGAHPVELFLCIGIGVVAYILFSYLTRSRELKVLISTIRKNPEGK